MDKRALVKFAINNQINYRNVRLRCLREAGDKQYTRVQEYTMQHLEDEIVAKEEELLAVETCPEEELQYYLLNNI